MSTHDEVKAHMGERPQCEITLVRAIGFDQFMSAAPGVQERIFFLGPQLNGGRDEGAHATEAAVLEFIDYWQNQINVAKEYLANGRDNRTWMWTKTGTAP